MPEVHQPHLEDEEDEQHEDKPETPAAAPRHRARGKTALKLTLEVLLISTGVFLGLAGEQWRESRERRERAEGSLRRFHTELVDNKKAVADVRDYHAKLRTSLKQYMNATPKDRKSMSLGMEGVRPAFFETTAWDLALATQSLADFPQDLAYEISRVYRTQQGYVRLSQGMLNSMYINPPTRAAMCSWAPSQCTWTM